MMLPLHKMALPFHTMILPFHIKMLPQHKIMLPIYTMNLPLYFITLYLNAAIILNFPIYLRRGQAVAPIALRNLYLKCCHLSNFFLLFTFVLHLEWLNGVLKKASIV